MNAQSTPDLLYSDVETELRASLRDLLDDKSQPSAVLARTESDEPYDLELWRTLAVQLGVASLQVPEDLGGQGASLRETALVTEELGKNVAPVPYLGSAVLATSTLLACDTTDTTVRELLAKLATGSVIGALGTPLADPPDTPFPDSVRAGAEGALLGELSSVADASAADVLLVPALGPQGPELYTVDTSAGGVGISEAVSLDMTRRIADVTLAEAQGHKLASGSQAEAALAYARTAGAGILASEQLGIAQRCLDDTVAYVRERYQFGRPVGSFQALKHRLADVYLELVSARAAARYAADTLARADADVDVAVALAQSYCAGAAVHAAEECTQLHGGTGMTWEHPSHLYLKRAKSDELAFGTPGRHRARLADLVKLEG